MANSAKSSKKPKYDPKAADRKRDLLFRIGITAVLVLLAVGLVFYIVSNGQKRQPGEVQAVRVVSTKLLKNPGTEDPKVVLGTYEDFQCPHCKSFEQEFGPTINKLVADGVIAVDYHMLAILNSQVNDNYSTRSANAAYCVAESDTTPGKEAFQRFHAALFAQQPAEGSPAPDDKSLIETARQAGVVGKVPECVNGGYFSDMVEGLAAATKVDSTPTIRINGTDFPVAEKTTPQDLVDAIKKITGDVPGLVAVPAGQAPEAPAPNAPKAPNSAPQPAP